MRDEEGRKKERSKQGYTKKQHNTPKSAVTFPKKNELPRVGFEPTTLCTLDRMYMYITVCVPVEKSVISGGRVQSSHSPLAVE